MAWSDLPQVPSRWNAGQPRCLQCRHLRIDDSVKNIYADAWCSLMPSFGFFNRHFAACVRFEDSGVCSRKRNGNAGTAQRAQAGGTQGGAKTAQRSGDGQV